MYNKHLTVLNIPKQTPHTPLLMMNKLFDILFDIKGNLKVTEHSFDKNGKIFLIVTIFAEDAVFATVHVVVWPKLCTDHLCLDQGPSKPLEILQKTLRQGMFYTSFTHFDREFELN